MSTKPSHARWRAIGAALLGLALVLGLTIVPQSIAAADASVVVEENSVFFDGFDGSTLDESKWLYTNGTAYPGGPAGFGTGEWEINQPQNTSVGNGLLSINPTRDEATKQWYSSRIETADDFLPAAGEVMTVSSRLALPDVSGAKAIGYWPAFWMLSSGMRADRWAWPKLGEFDIAESVSGRPWSNSVLHCGTWGGVCNEPEGINTGGLPCADTSCWGNFHEYKFVLDRTASVEVMRWYIDDTQTLEVRSDDPRMAGTVWSDMLQHGYNIILNVAISGAYPAKFNENATPETEPGHPLKVDWVSVVISGSATTPTVPTTPSAPTTATPASTAPTTPVTTPTVTNPPSTTAPTSTASTPPATTAPSTEGITLVKNGDSVHFSAVDFGSAPLKALNLRLRTSAPEGVSGTIEVHLDSATGPVVGTLSIGYGFNTDWVNKPLDSTATGTHDVWITASSGQPLVFAEVSAATVG